MLYSQRLKNNDFKWPCVSKKILYNKSGCVIYPQTKKGGYIMRKNYSKQQQTEIIKLYSAGNTVTKLSNQYGIARSTIYSWLNDSEL